MGPTRPIPLSFFFFQPCMVFVPSLRTENLEHDFERTPLSLVTSGENNNHSILVSVVLAEHVCFTNGRDYKQTESQ